MDGCLRTCVPAGDTCRVALQRVQTLGAETLGGVFTLADEDLSTRTFLYLYLDRSHHSLTGILVGACLTMIEHPPLSVDLADAAVGIAVYCGRSDGVALLVDITCASVDDGTAIGPRTQWVVAIGIGQRVV